MTEPSRRALLAASASAAALPMVLSACKGVQALGTPPAPASDIRLLRAAIAAEELMVARYAAAMLQVARAGPAPTASANSAVSVSLQAVHAQHLQHLAQLRSRLAAPSTARPLPSPAPPVLPTGAPAVLAVLEQAEQSSSDRLIGELAGLPPSLAQLFASIAASEATHVPYLRAVGQAG